MAPGNEYVEIRNDAYYVAGTRIGLDVIAHEFSVGRSPESIFQAYPSIGSLARVYGVITFMLENPDSVETYLKDQQRRYEKFQAQRPLPADMLDRYERAEVSTKPR